LTHLYITVVTPELQRCAIAELSAVAPDLHKVTDFEQGAFLVETQQEPDTFAQALVHGEPIFVKHIMPVQGCIALTRRRSDDLPNLLRAAQSLDAIRPGDHFTVQCRHVGKGSGYTAKDVEVFTGQVFECRGATPVFCDTNLRPVRGQDPSIDQYPDSELILEDWHKVVLYYLYGNVGYVGASTIGLCLNEHCDENRIFARRSRDVCRSEFKLLEALRRFRITLTPGRALDLGAAPGGWTKVLADRGMHVTAVDPAELDPKVTRLANVTHVRQHAEAFAAQGEYDLLVNDMVLPAERSAALMVQTAPHLRPGALAIMTIKLPHHEPHKVVDEARTALSVSYDVLTAKCLFHNRMEVTLLLRRA
jgi:23S rRNA (cytidine2498-2'-O)-methyltransferase